MSRQSAVIEVQIHVPNTTFWFHTLIETEQQANYSIIKPLQTCWIRTSLLDGPLHFATLLIKYSEHATSFINPP